MAWCVEQQVVAKSNAIFNSSQHRLHAPSCSTRENALYHQLPCRHGGKHQRNAAKCWQQACAEHFQLQLSQWGQLPKKTVSCHSTPDRPTLSRHG
jgi:hypothetical protein